MEILPLESLPLWANLLIFSGAAAVVWLAGTKLSRYADAISERTGVGKAFIGALLLGGITSLPEGATTVTASAIGNAPLAVNNIFGGVAMQVAILAVADVTVGQRALSASVRKPAVMLEGVLLVFVLAIAAGGILLDDYLVLGVGAWSAGIFAASVLAFFLIHQHRTRETWEPEGAEPGTDQEEEGEQKHAEGEANSADQLSTRRLVLYTALAGLAILLAGFVLARGGDVLAVQTGLGSSFVGAVLVAISTSLPEVSTTLGAVRIGQYAMAFSNIFGANILDCAILLLADVVYPGGPVLREVGRFTLTGAILGIVLTSVYLAGLLERRTRVVLRMGVDSLLVLILYLAGIYLLYTLR